MSLISMFVMVIELLANVIRKDTDIKGIDYIETNLSLLVTLQCNATHSMTVRIGPPS